MLDKSCQTGKHALHQRGLDLYETPGCAVEALLRVEALPPTIWEPAAGRGSIARVLRRAGHKVIATDVVRHQRWIEELDFLECRKARARCIVTNPPYMLAEQFVRHAIKLCPRVIMLLRLGFYESQRRSDILDSGHLARIHVFANRLPMMHRDGWDGPIASSAVPFAWFIWTRKRGDSTVIDRIWWQ